ncbi:unnamed protein product [Knipowitschia caucasica]|uniref:TGF-beta family profile domain-containing protein n=1 Tax=Knipowitschia caucasica TaxID=637954 RepID=A0AAV2JUE9_KNICA
MSPLSPSVTALLVSVCLALCACGQTPWPLGEVADQRQLLEALKAGILSSLGMEQPPVVEEKASDQELWEMQRLYREKQGEFGLNSSGDDGMSTLLLPHRVHTLHSRQRGELRRRKHNHWHRAEFRDRPRIQEEVSLLRAQLYMSRQILARPNAKVKLRIRGSKSSREAAWTNDATNMSQSVVLDVSSEVQDWIRNGGRKPFVVDVGHKGPDYNVTVSLKLTHGRKTTRTTRSVKEEEDCDGRDLCCRQSMTVSFKDIGWTDWVVAPLEYTMHFCRGSCPQNYRPASMHTQVKSRLAPISKGGIPRPCCVPAAYQPMVLMHYDSGGRLTLTPFEDLIVTKCYCA